MWTCTIDAMVDSGDLPDEETHPFWSAMDRLIEVMQAGGIHVCGNSDAPAWALSYRGDCAVRPEHRVLVEALALLTQARRGLPQSKWNVVLDDQPVRWREADGFLEQSSER